ncbi:MAG: tRNA threonylcarbamoyladenosine dehydratase [Oscillospiraceae bacterium]|nr:tRNA threonylcarbamoyladenosine dehydratase [Oscillospiraceae bacterium]
MEQAFSRTERLLGKAAMEKLAASRVAVFGIGGVGGFVCEALVRSGVGAFELVDSDTVSISNLNRQIIALRSTVGRYKTEVMKERMLDINPDADIRLHTCFFLPENEDQFPFGSYDYIVDAVDTVAAKLALAGKAKEYGIPVISAMGAGNKLEGSGFRVSDISETRTDPLARVMRRELKKRGIDRLKVVWSDEAPMVPRTDGGPMEEDDGGCRRTAPGSLAFVPSAAGLIIAGEVVKDLTAGLR